ncbi:BnaCnng52550D [Brassica napus]|uniref:BnaCnng52550D protein n=1 Tax=Brassica napus TaxID=3708 RepID=A0A078JK86_BRANA|nr:BnaCnng52550D [Brassica napus]
MELAPLPEGLCLCLLFLRLKNRRTRSRRWRKKKRRREIVCTSATPRLVETEQHDGPSAPRDYPRHRFRFLMAAQETIQDIGLGYYFYFFVDCGLGYF